MLRSVKIYKFYVTDSLNNLLKQLQNNKTDETCVILDEKKYYPEIKMQKDDNDVSIKGIMHIPVINETIEKSLEYDSYHFYLNKEKSMAIIQSKSNKPIKLLQNILKDKARIEEIAEDKNTMIEITNQIKSKFESIIHNPRFEFKGNEGYDGLSNSGFTLTRTRCATTRTKYASMLNRASMFEPIFKIFQMEGIIDNDGNGKLLKISRHFVFSMYVDGDFEYWVKFINKCVLLTWAKK